MVAIRESVRGYTADARRAFGQAPFEVALGLAVAGSLSYALALETDLDLWGRVFVFALLALPLTFGCTLLHALGRLGPVGRWAGTAVVAVAAAVYPFFVFDPDLASPIWTILSLGGAAWLALSLVPLADAGPPEGRRAWFWRFNARLVKRIAMIVAYGFALFLGLALALRSVSALFDLDVRGEAYAHLFGWIGFALVPWIVVGGVPALVRTATPVAGGALRFLRAVETYLVVPLLLTYAAILYAYVLRIAVIGEVPKNVLSPLVLGAGLLWLVANALLEPLRDDAASTGVSRVVRAYPLALLPMLALGLWAVWVRVDQYGWTEFRYIRLVVSAALGGLALLAAVRFLRKRPPPLVEVAAVFAAVLLLSAIGPWGALATSKRSQQARLRAAVERARILAGAPRADGGADARTAPTPVPHALYMEINTTAAYLTDHFGTAALGDLAPPVEATGEGRPRGPLAALLGYVSDGAGAPARMVEAGLPDTSAVAGVIGGTWYGVQFGSGYRPVRHSFGCRPIRLPEAGARRIPGALDTTAATLRLAGLTLVLDPVAGRLRATPAGGGAALVADLAPLVRHVGTLPPATCEAAARLMPAQATIVLRDADDRAAGQLVVTGIEVVVMGEGTGAGPGEREDGGVRGDASIGAGVSEGANTGANTGANPRGADGGDVRTAAGPARAEGARFRIRSLRGFIILAP